jgi:hypothetical protein
MRTLSTNFIQTGAWVVSTYKTINGFDLNQSVFDPYEAIILAGKTSMLLSPMRRLGVVYARDFEIYRKIAGLKPRESIGIIKILESLGEINVTWQEDSGIDVPISQISLNSTEKVDVLSITGKLFLELTPTAQAQITIHVLQETLKIPIPRDVLIGLLAAYEESIVDRTIQHLLAFKILSQTNDREGGSPLLYNPNAFQSNAEDVFTAINGLNSSDRQESMDILEFVRTNPGIPIPVKFNQNIVRLLISCGLVDSSAIVTSAGRVQQEFTTAPYIWGALGANELGSDVLDDAKLLLNCLRFGQLYSTSGRGKIMDPYVLVDALINKGSVGPASAIGHDYPMPLARGIVSIVESRIQPGRFHMELRKEDVAETVRDVLHTNGILPTPIRDEEIAQKFKQQGNFVSTEQLRVKKPLPSELEQERDSLAFSLRTHRRGR